MIAPLVPPVSSVVLHTWSELQKYLERERELKRGNGRRREKKRERENK